MSQEPALLESQFFKGLNVLHFRAFGILDSINFYRRYGKRKPSHSIVFAICMLYAVPYIFFQVLSIFLIKMDLQKLTFLYLICIPQMQTMSKVFSFWYRISDESKLFNLLKEDFLVSIPQHKRAEANAIYSQTARYCNLFFFLTYVGLVILVPFWIALPGYDTEPPVPGLKKVLSGWYPFGNTESPGYEIVRVYESLFLILYAPQFPLYGCVILYPIMGLYSHFTVLSQYMADLKKGNANDLVYNQELRLVLQDYNKLLRYSDILKNVYNLIMTIVLGTGTATLLLTVLNFLFEDEGKRTMMTTMRLLIFLSFEVVQSTLMCYSSSIVENASSEVLFAIYSSDWYLADQQFAMTAQMIMVRALRPVTLTAIKMYPVNLQTLLAMAQFVYTTAAVLSKMK